MLATNKELLKAGREGGYGVGAFNINNMEFVQAITGAAEELASPVIVAVSEGAIKYAGFRNIVQMVRLAAEERKAPSRSISITGRTWRSSSAASTEASPR